MRYVLTTASATFEHGQVFLPIWVFQNSFLLSYIVEKMGSYETYKLRNLWGFRYRAQGLNSAINTIQQYLLVAKLFGFFLFPKEGHMLLKL